MNRLITMCSESARLQILQQLDEFVAVGCVLGAARCGSCQRGGLAGQRCHCCFQPVVVLHAQGTLDLRQKRGM